MTVKQLKAKLAKLPDTMEVYYFDEEREFPCHPVQMGGVRKVEFREDPSDPKPMATEKVFILIPS